MTGAVEQTGLSSKDQGLLGKLCFNSVKLQSYKAHLSGLLLKCWAQLRKRNEKF